MGVEYKMDYVIEVISSKADRKEVKYEFFTRRHERPAAHSLCDVECIAMDCSIRATQ